MIALFLWRLFMGNGAQLWQSFLVKLFDEDLHQAFDARYDFIRRQEVWKSAVSSVGVTIIYGSAWMILRLRLRLRLLRRLVVLFTVQWLPIGVLDSSHLLRLL
jgi:hypothetical protein